MPFATCRGQSQKSYRKHGARGGALPGASSSTPRLTADWRLELRIGSGSEAEPRDRSEEPQSFEFVKHVS
jgi:hypothetical protein